MRWHTANSHRVRRRQHAAARKSVVVPQSPQPEMVTVTYCGTKTEVALGEPIELGNGVRLSVQRVPQDVAFGEPFTLEADDRVYVSGPMRCRPLEVEMGLIPSPQLVEWFNVVTGRWPFSITSSPVGDGRFEHRAEWIDRPAFEVHMGSVSPVVGLP